MQDRNEVIGGEFDIDLQSLQYKSGDGKGLEGVYKFASGRSALYYILLDAKERYGIDTVLLPDYLCSSVVIAAKKAVVKVVFYPLNEILEIDAATFANLYSDKSAVLIINYFGLKDITKQVGYVRSLNKGAVIIEDDVQAFYEFEKLLKCVDYKFTSLRKTFASPDGGLVKTSNQMQQPTSINRFHQYKLAGSILKSLRKPEYYDDEVYLSMFEKGESMIDDDIATGMSNMSEVIIAKADTTRVQLIRQRNAKFICDGLSSLGIMTIIPISNSCTPLFVPIYLNDRNVVRKKLFASNCFCPVHWPLEGMKVQKGAEMAEHELSLIVDQRYTTNDMEFILDILERSTK